MKSLKGCIVIGLIFGLATFAIAQEVPRSYYVSAIGNDQSNNGRSEATPFKTLKRAIGVASGSIIKRITVIGTLNQTSEGDSSGDGVFVIDYEGREELTITGKENASQKEKAVLSAIGTKKRVVIKTKGGAIRFENIEISGANIDSNGAGVSSNGGRLTLGSGTRIVNNIASKSGGGLLLYPIFYSTESFIEDGAEISNNSAKEFGGGIYFIYLGPYYSRAELTITGGTITNNTAGDSGGGLYISNESVISNVTINGNRAKNKGGGIYIGETHTNPEVVLTDCIVSNNKSEFGAGVYFRGKKFTLSSGTITANIADFVGGGIYIAKSSGASDFINSGADVSGNQAGDGGEDIFIQE
jgi:predicted outer membrane repeat protein